MDWVKDHWEHILVITLALVQVLNAATDRWDVMRGPWYKRLLALLTEIGSFLVSRDHESWLAKIPILGIVLGRLKLPLHPYGGKKKTNRPPPTIFPPGPTSLLFIAGGFVLAGCAGTWEDSADKSIRSAIVTAQSGWNTARAVYQQRCGQHINSCENVSGLDLCDEYKSCAAERRSHATTFRSVLVLCAEASDALQAYRKLKSATSNDGPQIPASELAKLKAQVQERIDRALRTSVEFMRALRVDKVIQ